jgi:DNA-binding transcriptional MerR regulator
MTPLIENILDSLRVTMTTVEELGRTIEAIRVAMDMEDQNRLDQAVLSETLQEVKDMKDQISELAEAVQALEEEAQ